MPKIKNLFVQDRAIEALEKLEKHAEKVGGKESVNNLINEAIIKFAENLVKDSK